MNIFKVSGEGAKKRPNGDTVHMDADGDADGEVDPSVLGVGMASVAARRASGFNMQMPPQRRTSTAGHNSGR